MGYIKQLSEELVKKIAAGEVIERPASVVKELVENSIDAGATKIEIEISRTGKYVKVSDNGMGIDPGDIPLLFSRHATSKIKRFDDLWKLDSLGFRGEALASISAVSKITCKSKHINQEYGFEIKLSGGETNKKNSGIAIGTVFEIDDLFYNVPARQKFLKSETTELGHIYDVIIAEALSRPKISFTLLNNKSTVLKSNGSNNLSQTIIELLGNDLQNKIISITAQNHFLDLNGYISALEVHRADRKSLFIFVNNRPVKCQIISKALLSAYEGLLPSRKFPVVVLNLKFKPTFVDINVHPGKKEVRYTQPNEVYNLVLHTTQNAISEHYKKEYKEKSVYSLSQQSVPVSSYTNAALEFYKPEDIGKELESCKEEAPMYRRPVGASQQCTAVTQLFTVSNLKCTLTYFAKPIANMTKIGNKTIFEVGSIFKDDMQVVFSGEVIGDQAYQKDFFNSLSELAETIYKSSSQDVSIIQRKLINLDLEEEAGKEKNRKKPPEKILYEVWERDNWTCVYCGKQLLDPKVVKEAIPHAKNAFIKYLNKEGKEVTTHILREHSASYDHYLPVSKLPQFNFEVENLFVCCFECNRKKLDSIGLETWKPSRQNSWTKPLEIGELIFNSATEFSELASK